MPGDLAYLQIDANYEQALDGARKKNPKKKIQHLKYFAEPGGDTKANNLREWERFVRDFHYAVSNFDSVLIDTASEFLEVRKLADWGRTAQIPAMNYGAFYGDFRALVKAAYDSKANVHFLHRLKPLYKNDVWDGETYQLEGWRGILFETQVYIEHERDEDDPKRFITIVKECTHDALLIGLELDSNEDENDYAHLAMRIFPDSEEKDWK